MGEMIVVYNTAYKVFLCVSILLLGLTIFLFFKFNIINIFKIRSGMAMNKTIRQMEAANQKSAALRYSSVALGERTPVPALGTALSLKLAKAPSAQAAEPQKEPSAAPAAEPQKEPEQRQTGPVEGSEFTAVLMEKAGVAAGGGLTEVLAGQAPGPEEGSAPTVLLRVQAPPETGSDFTVVLDRPSPQNPVFFEITRSIMYIHTDETL